MTTSKWITQFGQRGIPDSLITPERLGSKGAALIEMFNLGVRVPHGFNISTALCQSYYTQQKRLPACFDEDIKTAIIDLARATGKNFGQDNPLLVSVRSGAKDSMPGMMDTILNLGLNDNTVEYLAKSSKNIIFALDSYRRLIQMYSSVVFGIPNVEFEAILDHYQDIRNEVVLREVISSFKNLVVNKSGVEFPQDVWTQLKCAVQAVLNSWMSTRAVIFRKLNNLSDDLGTAVNIQKMVFGNLNINSATGVVFSRNPSTGEKKLYGEYLINAQGEDIVSGMRTPHNISADGNTKSMEHIMPEIYAELREQAYILENYYKDMQDIEFTVEDGVLYILQTRSAKRATAAAIKVSVDMVNEGLLKKKDAILGLNPESINQILHARIDYDNAPDHVAKGLPASPGAAIGIVVFSPYDAEELSHHHKVILVRNDTSPEDIKGMHVASGVLTVRGGMTSHAAVVARGMGKTCVCGVSNLFVNEAEKYMKIGDVIVHQGDEITIDGTTGNVFLGALDLLPPALTEEFEVFMKWVDEERCLTIRANAETPLDCNAALRLGAEGIGLCRTEHMFFRSDKIDLIREMIVSPNVAQRDNAIAKLLPIHKEDFKDIFRIMSGKPVNVRLLDPPLHEFLPQDKKDKHKLAQNLELPVSVIESRLHALHEVNPMMGHRGCRLGVTYPEIYEMQVTAIFSALAELKSENIDIDLEIMIPLISDAKELHNLKSLIIFVAEKTKASFGCLMKYAIGTMIELPRAALMAEEIAKEADYFSFGTNDLTQTTFGISRDDGASFLPEYLSKKLFEHDPFVKLDQNGVGELMKIAVERGKKSKPDIKLGVCGEHAGDPSSIEFFYKIGIDYVSCSPYRVPIAKIAAAQVALRHPKNH
jgi:pyruvate, orthophosphate dikinase